MNERCCIFIDGENLRHSIVKLFDHEFEPASYLPKQAKWGEWFDWLTHEVTSGGQRRVRSYWYVVEHIDFWPYAPFPTDEQKLEQLLKKDFNYKTELETLHTSDKQKRMKDMLDELNSRRETMARRFDGWRRIQDGITAKHDAVEFRRSGAIKYDLFKKELGSEKSVDVKLAADMITLKDIYYTAIILSGDQDYVPAVQVVKDSGKRVVNVSFRTRNGKDLPGGARRLNHITDSNFSVEYAVMKNYMNI